jgi:hypothetical protein
MIGKVLRRVLREEHAAEHPEQGEQAPGQDPFANYKR